MRGGYSSCKFSRVWDFQLVIMFRKAPKVIGVSIEKIRKIVELLRDTKKYTMSRGPELWSTHFHFSTASRRGICTAANSGK